MTAGAFITGLGHFLPPRLIRNEDLAPGVAPDPAGITKRTGIVSRHYAPVGMNTSDMAIEASRAALTSARLAPGDIDCIVAATLSPNYAFPGIGVYIQHQLGFPQIPAYDIRNQCSGFLYALNVARAFLAAGFHKKILLACAELQSHALGQTEMHAHITPLFGDGAGAMVVCDEPPPHAGGFTVDHVRVYSDGSGADRLRQRVWDTAQDPFTDWRGVAKSAEEFVHCEMDGQFIFRKAVAGMADAARTALKAEGLTIADVDWVVPHQANLNINKTVGSVLKLPPEKMLSNIQRVGNTTAASIPILLSESVEAGIIKPGHRVLSLAFGSGLTWERRSCARYDAPVIRAEKRPGVLTLTLDRPSAKNALDLDMVTRLRAALGDLDQSTLVVVLKSAVKGVFSLGMDLSALDAGLAAGAGAPGVIDASTQYVGLLKQLSSLRAITIAEVGGMAIGGGVDLMSCCDLVIASDDSAFSIAQLRKGIFPLTTSGVVTPRIGHREFLYWMLSGQNYSAEKARRLGLVSQVVPAADLGARVSALVDRVLGYDGEAVKLGIEAMRVGPALPLAERLDHLGALLALNCQVRARHP